MTKPAAWPPSGTSHTDFADHRQALLLAADRARLLVDAMVRLKEDSPVASVLAQRLEELLELLAGHVQPVEAMSKSRQFGAADRSMVSGALNPMAPPVQLSMGEDNTARTTTALGLAYQGPPGRVHGGMVATLLDHLMGYAAGTVGSWIFTRSLTVDYDHAVPLFEELEIVATVERVDGRKIWVRGEIRAAGAVVARAHGLWLPPRVNPESCYGVAVEELAD